MITRGIVRALVALALIAPMGCSFGYSSESSWKTLTSPSTSSSSSSGGQSKKAESYREDVRDYTYAYASSSKDNPDGFQRGIGDIARKHGITNWQAADDTWIGIGAGLAKAKVARTALGTFQRNLLADSDPGHLALIQRGYDG